MWVTGMRERQSGQTKVKRYWPGKAPEWAEDPDEESDITTCRPKYLDQAGDSELDDPRLRRLAQSSAVDREEIRADHRRIRQAEMVWTEDAEEEDEDALEERKRRIRQKLLHRQQAPLEEEEEDESEEEPAEYEYEMDVVALAKPVVFFVPKLERDTIAERERVEEQEQAAEEAVRRRIEERKAETKQIVVDKIREEQEIHKNLEEANGVDMDLELNDADRESWKGRVIARIKRDREDRESIFKVSNMTEEERSPKKKEKKKWRFMQKYYHKGAFFQSDADDDGRDFSAPTGEDKMDKTLLPKVMQVKHFGQRGRTKWSHLVNEDTSCIKRYVPTS